MTLWNVAVLALILGALGGVVRYNVQADLFATVDRALAERAHAERPLAERDAPVIITARTTVRSRLLDPMKLDVAAEGSFVGSKRALPPLQPRVISRDPAPSGRGGPGGAPREEPWDRHSYLRSLPGPTVHSTVRDRGWPAQ